MFCIGVGCDKLSEKFHVRDNANEFVNEDTVRYEIITGVEIYL